MSTASDAPVSPHRGRSDRIGTIAALFALAVVSAIVAAVFWPGHMNQDTWATHIEAVRGTYSDWHSAIWTGIWRVLVLVGLGNAGCILAGQVMTMLVGLYLLLRVRLGRPWAVLLATLVLVFPPVLAFAIDVGTDVWFAVSLIAGFGFISLGARTRGRTRTAAAVTAAILGLLALAARPTAAVPLIALFTALALVVIGTRLGGWRRPLAAGACGVVAAALAFGGTLAVQRYVLHAKSQHPEQESYEYDLIALSLREKQVLLPAEAYSRPDRQDLSWLATYGRGAGANTVDISPLLWGAAAAIDPLVEGERLDVLQHAWLAAIRQHPFGYLQTRMQSGLWQLGITGPVAGAWYGPTPAYMGFGPVLMPAVQDRVNDYVDVGTAPDSTGGPLQEGWVYMIVLVLAAVLMLARRKENAILGLLSVALLLYTVEVIFLSPAVTFRYVWPAVTTATLLSVILAIDVAGWLWSGARRLAGALSAGRHAGDTDHLPPEPVVRHWSGEQRSEHAHRDARKY